MPRKRVAGLDQSDLPRLAAPARRALEAAGLASLESLARVTEKDLLALHGMGPKAVYTLRAALKERGIRKVHGDVYLAHGLFEAPVVHPDWPRDQLTEWYEAPVDALSFNDNCVLVRVSPGTAGRPPRVEVLPEVNALTVENTAVTRTAKRGPRLLVQRVGSRLLVRGSVPRGAKPYETWVTVPDPALYFGAGLKAALSEEGIEVTGSLRPVKLLPGAVWERVAVHRSDLLTAVRTINKRSQNFYAEALAKLLGARLCGEGSWERGVRAISEFIEAIGIPRGTFDLADGSGMSRKNRFTPRQITHLLRTMAQHPRANEFMRSLPYSGEANGGWKRRLAAPPYAGNVMAKTGTLSEVSTLSGYAKAASGKLYAFSILINKANGQARMAQDRLVMTLIDNGYRHLSKRRNAE